LPSRTGSRISSCSTCGCETRKEEATEEVLFAIRSVLEGELYLSRKLAIRLVRKTIESRPALAGPGLESLTDREL
jgi:DNA-binding NarL/FixJ family response regulator